MGTPQSAILPEPNAHSRFLILRLDAGAADARRVARALAGVPALTAEVGALDRQAGLVSAVGLGAELWARLSPDRTPPGLAPATVIRAEGREAPATGGDVLLHVNAARADLTFELAARVFKSVGGALTIADEVAGFPYLDGRTKPDSRELPDAVRPPTAHISRVVIEEDGEELEIVRHSLPYASVGGERGLFFIAYSRTLATFDRMLARMFGTSGDGMHDRLMEFSRPVTGAYFFAPPVEVLEALGR